MLYSAPRSSTTLSIGTTTFLWTEIILAYGMLQGVQKDIEFAKIAQIE